MKRAIVFALILGSVAWLSACRMPTSGLSVESYPHNTIRINSKIVGGLFEVEEIAATNQNGLLRAQVSAVSQAQRDLQLEYRFRWTEATGMEVDTRTSTWTLLAVNAKERAMMQGIAPQASATDFILDVRFRRPNTRWE
jgi:uncharacterized protein YcfL